MARKALGLEKILISYAIFNVSTLFKAERGLTSRDAFFLLDDTRSLANCQRM